jgi:hypothetical protein
MADNYNDLLRQYFTTGYKRQEGILAFNPLPYMPHHSGRGVYYQGPLDKMDESHLFVGGPHHMVGFGTAFGTQGFGRGRGPPQMCDLCPKICGNAPSLRRHRIAKHEC